MRVESERVRRALEELNPAALFGNTVFVDTRQIFLGQRTETEPLPTSWTCTYCHCVNPPENVHCEHCGAPHVEKKPEQKRELTWPEAQQLLKMGVITEEEASNYDPSQYEPDEDAERVIKF